MTDKLVQIGGTMIRGTASSSGDYLLGVSSVGVLSTTTATIASGQSLSGAVDIGDNVILAIIMPSAWTTADLTLQASADGTTYNNVYDVYGAEYTIKADASRFIPLNPNDFVGMRYVKLRSGTSSTAVNQAAERMLTLVIRPV